MAVFWNKREGKFNNKSGWPHYFKKEKKTYGVQNYVVMWLHWCFFFFEVSHNLEFWPTRSSQCKIICGLVGLCKPKSNMTAWVAYAVWATAYAGPLRTFLFLFGPVVINSDHAHSYVHRADLWGFTWGCFEARIIGLLGAHLFCAWVQSRNHLSTRSRSDTFHKNQAHVGMSHRWSLKLIPDGRISIN